MRATYTLVTLEVSAVAYDEVRAKLYEAGYDHAFRADVSGEGEMIDMQGIALVREAQHYTGKPQGS